MWNVIYTSKMVPDFNEIVGGLDIEESPDKLDMLTREDVDAAPTSRKGILKGIGCYYL